MLIISCNYSKYLLPYWGGNRVFDELHTYDCQYPVLLNDPLNPKIAIKNCYLTEDSPIFEECNYKKFEPIKELENHYPKFCIATAPIQYGIMAVSPYVLFVYIPIIL